jgi:hypothetical protein
VPFPLKIAAPARRSCCSPRHPVAVALAITTGGLLAGIGGTVAAVPLLAAVHAMMRPETSADGVAR